MKDTVFPHQRGDREVVIRETFVAICESDHCAAALLDAFERLGAWDDWRAIPKRELHEAIIGLFSIRSINPALARLERLGYLKRRTPDDRDFRNGNYYLVLTRAVAEAVRSLPPRRLQPSPPLWYDDDGRPLPPPIRTNGGAR